MKPGPAMSSAAMWRCTAGCRFSAAISACATSRGFFFSGLASCMAAVLAKSPCVACLGDSNATGIVAPGLTSWMAAASAASSSFFASIIARF